MSSPPALVASRNMSACNLQAVSQVGCRLMVASSANTSRPRVPDAEAGPSARTRSMNWEISGRDDAGAGVCWDLSLLIAPFYTDLARVARARGLTWPCTKAIASAAPRQCLSGWLRLDRDFGEESFDFAVQIGSGLLDRFRSGE